MNRFRTIKETTVFLQKADPETPFTTSALRTLVKQGKIPVLNIGTKQLIDIDRLSEYLNVNNAKTLY